MTLLTIDLRADAAAETERLRAARALARQGDPGDPGDDRTLACLEGDGAWAMAARAPTLRRMLGHRALLLWRVAYEDAGGRIVESHLAAIAVRLAGAGTGLRRRAQLDALVRAIERDAVEMVERSCDAWRAAVEQTTGAFAKTRAARALAIGPDVTARHDPRVFQPGLFDRRASRIAQMTAGRPDTIASVSAVARRPQLRLVVVP